MSDVIDHTLCRMELLAIEFLEISKMQFVAQLAISKAAAAENARPSRVFLPELFIHYGGKWCAWYGATVATGLRGYGDSPEAAMLAFDEAWTNGRRKPSVNPPTGAPTWLKP